MKRNVAFLVCVALFLGLCLVFVSCDAGLRYKTMETVSLPEKLVYSTEDTALDFTGGVVELTSADGTTEIRQMQEYTYQTHPLQKDRTPGQYIYSDVIFTVPGTYTVTIVQTDGVTCSYQITVQ